MSFYEIRRLVEGQAQAGERYLEFLRVSALSAGVYVLPAGATDAQKPHTEDEVYYVVSGRAHMRVGSQEQAVGPGSLIFVEAETEHRFFDISEQLEVLVLFAPAEKPVITDPPSWPGLRSAVNRRVTTTVGEMTSDDWSAVRRILFDGIATGHATFETEIPEWQEWNASHLKTCRLVAREEERVRAWAALSPVSRRRVYAGVAEVSIYVAAEARGRGIGRLLLGTLIAESERHGIWTLQAGVFPENTASVALLRSWGFREVGLRQRIGKLGNRWRDVLLLERRSPRVES